MSAQRMTYAEFTKKGDPSKKVVSPSAVAPPAAVQQKAGPGKVVPAEKTAAPVTKALPVKDKPDVSVPKPSIPAVVAPKPIAWGSTDATKKALSAVPSNGSATPAASVKRLIPVIKSQTNIAPKTDSKIAPNSATPQMESESFVLPESGATDRLSKDQYKKRVSGAGHLQEQSPQQYNMPNQAMPSYKGIPPQYMNTFNPQQRFTQPNAGTPQYGSQNYGTNPSAQYDSYNQNNYASSRPAYEIAKSRSPIKITRPISKEEVVFTAPAHASTSSVVISAPITPKKIVIKNPKTGVEIKTDSIAPKPVVMAAKPEFIAQKIPEVQIPSTIVKNITPPVAPVVVKSVLPPVDIVSQVAPSVQKIVDKVAVNPAVKPVVNNVVHAIEKPVVVTDVKPVEKHVEISVKSIEKPIVKSAERSADKEKLSAKRTEEVVEKVVVKVEEKSAEKTDEKPAVAAKTVPAQSTSIHAPVQQVKNFTLQKVAHKAVPVAASSEVKDVVPVPAAKAALKLTKIVSAAPPGLAAGPPQKDLNTSMHAKDNVAVDTNEATPDHSQVSSHDPALLPSPTPIATIGKYSVLKKTSVLEEGEIVEAARIYPLAHETEGITYPAGITKPDYGKVKRYSRDFLFAFVQVIAKPADMMAPKDIYVDGGGAGVRMDRGNSDGARNRNGKNSSSRGRPSGSQGAGMQRQQSSTTSRDSRTGHMPPSRDSRDSRGSRDGHGGKGAPSVASRPLKKGENAWDAKKLNLSASETVLKLVKGTLNKLTLDNFPKLSQIILECDIDDQVTLAGVITLIFEKAIDEPHFAVVYAMLCAFLYRELGSAHPWMLPAEGAEKSENLFRFVLLARCQYEFGKDAKWAAEDELAQVERRELRKMIHTLSDEEKLKIAEEDYERGKLKRRVLGNVQFVGELFLQGLISEKIIHGCIMSFLRKKETEEEDVESLCKFISSVGKNLDNQKNRDTMEAYFGRLKELSEDMSLSSRIRFTVLDVIDLRRDRWVSSAVNSKKLKTLAEVRGEDEKERNNLALKSKQAMNRGSKGSQGGKSIMRPTRDDRRDDRPAPRKDEGGWNHVPKSTDNVDISARKTWGTGGSRGAPESAGQARIAVTANSFGALLDTDAAAEEVEVSLPPVSQMVVMEAAFKDYRDSYSSSDLLTDIAALNEDAVIVKLVKNVAQLLLDKNGLPALKILSLMNLLFFDTDSRFSVGLVVEGFKQFFVAFDDDRSDFPKGFSNMSQVLSPLYSQNLITFAQLLEITSPIDEYAALPAFLADFLKVSEAPLGYIVSTQFDINPFFTNEKTRTANIEKWIKMKSLHEISAMNDVVGATFTACGFKAPSYRYFNQELDAELLSNEKFTSALVSSLLSYVLNGELPSQPSQELYLASQLKVSQLAPIFSDLISPADLLSETDRYCSSNSITYLLENFLRMFVDGVRGVTHEVNFEFEAGCGAETGSLLLNWFKSLRGD